MQFRKTGIGSSDAPVACGVSKWRTPLDLYLEKTGAVPGFAGNLATRVGSALEPVIKHEFSERTGLRLRGDCPMVRSTRYRWMLATPDDLTVEETPANVECKSTGSDLGWGPDGSDEVPEEHVIQAHHQMIVTGCRLTWLPVLIGQRDFRVYQIPYSEELARWIIDMEDSRWREIQELRPPEIDFSHAEAIRAINAAAGYLVADNTAVEFDERFQAANARLADLREAIKAAEDEADACKAFLLAGMGTAKYGLFPDGSAVQRSYTKASTYTVNRKESISIRAAKSDKLPRELTLQPIGAIAGPAPAGITDDNIATNHDK